MPVLEIKDLNKTYKGGFAALKKVNLSIHEGEIFALLGPNGAGKTTLINIVCGIVRSSGGTILAGGFDVQKSYRDARKLIGLVPQELATDTFESVWATVNFSRGLFGKAANPEYIEQLLKDLSLWDKKDNRIMTLSGGMKRRVLIAKALSHEPSILFLDEPTAGVDVELRHDMWNMVHKLRERGVTIILTTHYIEEAEEMADRIGIINHGELIMVEEKKALMQKLGQKRLTLTLREPCESLPAGMENMKVELADDKRSLIYTFDSQQDETGIADLLRCLNNAGVDFKDLHSEESTLEDIFVELVRNTREPA